MRFRFEQSYFEIAAQSSLPNGDHLPGKGREKQILTGHCACCNICDLVRKNLAMHHKILEKNARVVFVLPAKNEQHTIGALIQGLRRMALGRGWQERIVVASDSTDRTAEIAESFGALVVQGGGIGLGEAMAKGLSAALSDSADWIVTLDSDGQVHLDELPLFFEAATQENADVVISSRFLRSSFDYRYPFLNWLGNRILVAILRLATGRKFTDSHGGIRLMRPEAVRGIVLIGRHTYVQETLIQMHMRGFKIVELPSRWQKREAGESRVLQSITRYIWRTLPALMYWSGVQFFTLILAFAFALDFVCGAFLPRGISLFGAVALALFSRWLARLPLQAIRIHDDFGA